MAEKESEFDKLARLIKEEGEDIRSDVRDQVGTLRTEVHHQIGELHVQISGLRKEMHDGFAGINRRLDQSDSVLAAATANSRLTPPHLLTAYS